MQKNDARQETRTRSEEEKKTQTRSTLESTVEFSDGAGQVKKKKEKIATNKTQLCGEAKT